MSRRLTVIAPASSRTSATTRWPPSSSAGTTWLPTNPLAPVTRIVTISRTHHCALSTGCARAPPAARDLPSAHEPLRPADLRALTLAMPKAELHLHLDGSLRIDTALDLAKTRGVDAPTTFEGMRGALVGPDQVEDQAELLLAFDLPIALMQDAEALERTAADLVEDKARENVRYAEIRWAPLLHAREGTDRPRGRGGDLARARPRWPAGPAIEVRLIATLMRSHPPERNLAFVEDMAANGIPDGLVAVDLAGQEARFPDPELHRRRDRAGAGDRPPRHAPRRRVGRRRAGRAVAGPGAGADRARAAGDRGPGASSRS